MDKKALVTFLVASSFASTSFAISFNKLILQHSGMMPSIVKTHKPTTQMSRSYTDFSGTWNVNCGNGSNISTVIQNDANYITFDGNEFRIGLGLKGQSESNVEYTSSDHTSFEWNEDGSALIMKFVGILKDNTNRSTIETDISQFSLTMKNNQIHLDGKFTIFEDLNQIAQPTNMHCVLTKKQS